MKYLRRHNLNLGNVLDDTILQTADGNIELNPTHRVVIRGDLTIEGGSVPGPEVTNVMYVTLDGDDSNTGLGEGPTQAKRTIKAAVAAAQEGTTIFVRSGEFYEDNPIRLPPKVSIIGDNLRRTILRPLNGPKKFTVSNVTISNGEVLVTTSTNHNLRLHDRVRVIIPEASIDIDSANVSEIVSATQFKYKDSLSNLSLTPSTQGTVEFGVDFFFVSNQSYIAQLVFKGLQAPSYCINIDKDAIVDTSPYIQNCSNINGPWLKNGTEWLPFITEQPDLTGAMVKGPRPLRDDEINPAQLDQYGVNDRGAGGGMLIDGDRYNSESPIKSMVADAFTQVAQGAVGFHITNFGYMQIVSCFNVFCDKAYLTTRGGYLSISNSVVDFGNYGFYADGYYPVPYAKGIVNTSYYSRLGNVSVLNEGTGYTSIPSVTVQPPTPIPGSSTPVVTANVDPIRGTVNAITIDDPGYGYTFEPTITVDPPFTPFVVWQPSTSYTLGQYVVFDTKEYQVTQAGTSGLTPPVHSAGLAFNGTVQLNLVGTVATATASLETNLTITVNGLSERPQVASLLFIGSNPIGYYIKSTSNSTLSFRYIEIKCRRDVGYIVDAVLSDLIFDTNFRSIYAGRAYLRSYSSKVLSSQRAQTIAGINQARDQVKARISPADPVLEGKIDTLFGIVTNIIQTGIVGASLPNFTNVSGRPAGFIEARDILLANKSFIQDQIVDYITNNLQGFQYDEVKCRRDVGIIINSVMDDLVLGTNYLSKTSGLAYLRSYSNEVIENQKIPTVAGIERAKNIVLKLLQDELDSEIKIKSLFDSIITILKEGKETAAPITSYTDPIGVSSTTISSARTIETNKINIVQDVIEYINDNLNPSLIPDYNENTCRRDLNYIIDALIFDLLYAGNSATVNVANSYFNASGSLVIPNQISQHANAFNELKSIISSLVPSVSTTTNNLINIIINAVQTGQGSIPSATDPTYTFGSLYQYYNDERSKIQSEIENIKDEVIDYLNNEYSGNFTYVEATCRRDIDYIIDALAYDLSYGGNTQITNAALSYSEGSVIAGEVEETKQAYQYWKSIIPYILQNQPVPNAVLGQNTSLPLGSPVPLNYPSEIVQNLIQIVVDVIDYGPGYVPEPVTESDFSLGDSSLVIFKELVLDDLADIQDFVIDYLNDTYGGSVDITVFPGIIDIPAGTVVQFNNVSTISTGGTALEYVGAGVTYNALPFFGGNPDPAKERTELNNGRCFTVTNDQVGNFRIGNIFELNGLTGDVSINANELELQGIASLGPFKRNGISVGVAVKEISNNPALIASTGTQDINTVPTQQAVSTYVENRYLNKVQSTTAQTVESNVAFIRDVEIRGGDLITDQTTFNIINSNATTVNAFGAATAINMGANSGTLTVGNPTVVGTQTTQNVYDTVATTVNAFGASTSLNVGNATSSTVTLRPGTLVGSNTTQNLYNTVATTVNAFGDATSLNVGNATAATITLRPGTLVGSNTTQNLYNTVATTVNAFGAATGINIGANSGTITIGNPTLVGTQATQNLYNTVATTVNAFGDATSLNVGNATAATITLRPGTLVGSNTTQNLYNTVATTVNAFSAATAINIGANSGTITIGNPTVVGTQTTQNLYNTVATTVNAFGDATTLNIGNATAATVTLRPGTLVGSNTTQNLYNTVATTVNAFGDATTLNIGNATAATVTLRPGTLVGSNTTQNIYDTVATTVNFARAATAINIGANSGTLTIGNPTVVGTQTTQNLYNTVATTVNAFGAATAINVGANSGTITIGNPTLVGTQTTQNIYDTVATTVNFARAATAINMGANSGTLTIGNPTIVGTQTTQNVYNTVATTVNAFGDATTLAIGNATAATVTLRPGTLVGSNTTQNLYNTVATTVNAFGAATAINIGANSGTLTVGNPTLVGTQTTQNVYDTVATTVNFARAATAINMGANSGTLTVGNPTLVGTQTTQNVYNTVATTVNAFGAATTLNMGAATGTFTINSQQTIFNSTDSIQIPVGTTAQRDSTPVIGQIRYNTTLTAFEGYGPGNAWGTLGGVIDIDRNTYIIAEFTPGANDNTLWFYNDAVQTLTITKTNVEFQSPVVVTVNNTTDSTANTNGALVVDGGIGVAKSIVGAGFVTNPTTGAITTINSSIQSFVIDEGEY